MKSGIITVLLFVCLCGLVFAAGSEESASSSERGLYLAEQGLIIPPEEVYTNSYIASIDYGYPLPGEGFGVYLYSSNKQVSSLGQEVLLQFGIQGSDLAFEQLPPMNLVYVIDTSSSMNDEDKIEWVKQGFEIFLEKIRDQDYLSLVTFSDEPEVIFSSTRMDSPEKRRRFRDAVLNINPSGGSNLEAGLETGYEQILANYRTEYINRVLFLSDGTEFSSRLAREGAQTGDIRISLIWENYNDLDLHVRAPGGEKINYAQKISRSGGRLDVDMNAGGEKSNKPVENIFWGEGAAPAGIYSVSVVNYAYHEPARGAFPFSIEIKNGDEYSHFEGTINGAKTEVQVAEFEYKTSGSIKREKASIYELASAYKDMGINISTIGVGVEFDVDMMTNLAKEGGGSSRFISGREGMEKIFGSEFARMAVPLARDLNIEFSFDTDVEILDTWGYNHVINENSVSYYLPTLHLADYETILLKYFLPEQSSAGELPVGRLKIDYTDLFGKPGSFEPLVHRLSVVEGEPPLTGISDAMLLHSGNMMLFAEKLKEIGEMYYSALDLINYQGDEAAGMERLKNAMELTAALKKQLLNARLRLDQEDYFTDQITILDNYITALGEDMGIDSVLIDEQKNNTEIDPAISLRALDLRITDLCNEILLELEEADEPTVALSGFSSKDGVEYPMLGYLEEISSLAFSRNSGISLIERNKLDEILEEQKLGLTGLLDTDSAVEVGNLLAVRYIVTGTVIPMPGSVVVFSRLIDVETAEILNAAQVILSRADAGGLMDM